jgi:hypothetical protein
MKFSGFGVWVKMFQILKLPKIIGSGYSIKGKTLPITHPCFLVYNYFHPAGKKLVAHIFFYDHGGVDTDHPKGIIKYRID